MESVDVEEESSLAQTILWYGKLQREREIEEDYGMDSEGVWDRDLLEN